MRAKLVTNVDGTPYGIRWDCPGCGDPHVVPTTGPKAWGFNGDFERPTLTPSVLSRWCNADDVVEQVCHVFIREGHIQFLNDCTHALAGKTVEMPELT